MPNKIVTAAIACTLLVLSGCSFIPEYQQPEMPVANTWPAEETGQDQAAPSGVNAADIAWQDYFTSDTLRQVIDLALENNRDLKVALLNIDRAKAAYQIQDANTWPVVNGSAGVNKQRVAEDNSMTGETYTSDPIMSVGVGITAYEFDFFGKVKSMKQSALEAYLATRQAAQSVRIALVAQTANAYVNLLAQKKLLALAQETFDAQKSTYDVIKDQYEAGATNQLSVAQAGSSAQTAKVSIARYKRLVAQAENALVYLAGPTVYELINTPNSLDDVAFLSDLPPGLPSEILLARPDIQAAEHQLKAANANIGAARAALYPSISLTGSMGFAASDLSYLFDPSRSFAWVFSPNVSIPVFNRKGLNASLDVATIEEKIAAAQYEGVIQTAFREVADQLAARKNYKDQLEAQDALVAANQESYDLSKARYDNGIDDFLAVLDSQRALFSAEQGAILLKQSCLSNLINLYKAMGGGRMLDDAKGNTADADQE